MPLYAAPVSVSGVATGGTKMQLTLVSGSALANHRWGIRPSGGAWADAVGSANPSAPGVTTFNVTGLTPGVLYEFRARSEDGFGANSAYVMSAALSWTHNTGSGDIPILLPDDTLPTLAGTLVVDIVSSKWVQLSHPAGADFFPDPLTYEYSSDGELTWNVSGTSETTHVIMGLTPSIPYDFAVRCRDRAGNVSTPALRITQATNLAGSLSTAIASWLLPYSTLQVLNDAAWTITTDPPELGGAIGFRVYFDQELVNNGTRSEVSIDFPWEEGDSIVYRWKLMIPSSVVSDTPRNHWWVITQWHDQPDLRLGQTWTTYPGNSPPLSVNFGEIDAQGKLSINYGAPDPSYFGPLLDIERDTVYDMEMTVKWSRGDDGSASLKMDNVLVWGHTGPNMHNAYQHNWKLGQYRANDIGGISIMYFGSINASVLEPVAPVAEIAAAAAAVAAAPVAYEIPFEPRPQTFLISLGGTSYRLRTSWNTVTLSWVLDIFTPDQTPIVTSIPIVTGVDLLGQFKHLGIAGRIFVQSSDEVTRSPGYADLGVSSLVFFVTP